MTRCGSHVKVWVKSQQGVDQITRCGSHVMILSFQTKKLLENRLIGSKSYEDLKISALAVMRNHLMGF